MNNWRARLAAEGRTELSIFTSAGAVVGAVGDFGEDASAGLNVHSNNVGICGVLHPGSGEFPVTREITSAQGTMIAASYSAGGTLWTSGI